MTSIQPEPDLSSFTTEQLKAMAYDLIAQREQLQKELQRIAGPLKAQDDGMAQQLNLVNQAIAEKYAQTPTVQHSSDPADAKPNGAVAKAKARPRRK